MLTKIIRRIYAKVMKEKIKDNFSFSYNNMENELTLKASLQRKK